MIDTNGFDNARVDQLLALDDRSAPMTERKPQIAYAPVHNDGRIAIEFVQAVEDKWLRRRFVYNKYKNWRAAKRAGWRIARVLIELDEEKSGE